MEMDNEVNGGHARLYIYRISKKNHDTIVRLNGQFTDTLGKDGPLCLEFFLSQQYRELDALYQYSQNCLC
jgi:hypothetical protein